MLGTKYLAMNKKDSLCPLQAGRNRGEFKKVGFNMTIRESREGRGPAGQKTVRAVAEHKECTREPGRATMG